MIIVVSRHELKMVLVIATALALGVGAVAACVVPWFYCKPKNDGDDEREANAIRDDSGVVSRSRSNAEDVSSTTMGIRIHGLRGFNFIRVVIPSDCVNSNTSELSASRQTTMETSTLHTFCRENSALETKRLPIEAAELRSLRSKSVESTNPEAWKSGENSSQPETSENAESIDSGMNEQRSVERSYVDSQSSASGTIDTGTSNLSSPNLGLSSSGMLNSRSSSSDLKSIDESSREITDGRSRETRYAIVVSRRNAVEASMTVESSESSNHMGESSKKSIGKTAFCQELEKTRGTSRSDSINALATTAASDASNCPDESPTESTNATSSSQEYKNSDAKSQQNLVNASRNVASLESSNYTDESSTETTQRTSTSRESSNVSEPPKNPHFSPSIESPIMERCLDTICETSVCPETPRESINDQQQPLQDFTGSNEMENARMKRVLFTSISAGNSKRTRALFNVVAPMSNPSFDKSPESIRSEPCNDERERKSSKYSRYRLALTDGLKTVWRSMKFDRIPRTPRDSNRYESGVESVHSLSAGAKIPAGHSTLNEPRGSNVFEKVVLRQFQANENLEIRETNQPVMMLEDEPLDLSMRSSSDFRGSNDDSALKGHARYSCTTGFGEEVFREFSDFFKIRGTSVRIDEDPTRSDSIEFYDGEAFKLRPRDENENITLDSPVSDVNMKMRNTSRFDEYLEIDRRDFDNSKNVDEKGLSQKFKDIFNLRSKIGGLISSSGKKEKRRKFLPDIQRDSTEICCNANKNRESGDPTNLVSPDIAPSLVLGFNTSREEENVPCTEL